MTQYIETNVWKTPNDHNHTIKNSYQLVENMNKIKIITNVETRDFKNIFYNINLQDLNKIINSLFQGFYNFLIIWMQIILKL